MEASAAASASAAAEPFLHDASWFPLNILCTFNIQSLHAPTKKQSGNTNAVFACTLHDKTEAYLRLTTSMQRTTAEVEAEVAWMKELVDVGLAVAQPIPSKHGRLAELFDIDADAGNHLGSRQVIAVLVKAVGGR
jgi:hypothetical protein